jgi:hypothetical protein
MKRVVVLLALSCLPCLAVAPAAQAAFGLQSFDVTYTGPKGETDNLAGSHPYAMKTSFQVNTETNSEGTFPEETVKDMEIFQIPGFIGDTSAVRQCSTLDFLVQVDGNATECPDSTAVGRIHVEVSEGEFRVPQDAPVYNLTPTPGSVARLGFNVASTPVAIAVNPEGSPPYRVVAHTRNVSQILEFYSAELTLWGVPGDPRHDEERGHCYEGGKSCSGGEGTPIPFITLPRACEGPLPTSYEMDSWEHPGAWVRGSVLTHDELEPPNPQGMIGCGDLGFNPTTRARPSSAAGESSAGMDFEIDVADEGLKSPEGRAEADIKGLRIAFPRGLTANPSAAQGLGVCTLAQYEAESLGDEACPPAAKLGTIEAETPILPEHPLRGSLYLASQRDNPFGSLLALYTVIRDPELGVFVKFATKVETDEATGQLVVSAANLPPYPLSHVKVHLRPGPRAPFVTPPACGTYATEATLYPSSGGAPLTSRPTFAISSGPGGGPCPSGSLPFHPALEAGSLSNAAGAFSPFDMRLTRQDGDQDITRFSAVLPPGVAGRITGVGRCSDAQIARARARSGAGEGALELADPSCPASSLIGHVLTGAGVGSSLTYVPGSVYLAGPFGGDPLSVVAIVPAVAGPFDIGTVVTREALTLNETTGEVEVDGSASEPIPHILKGIPLKVRDLRIYVDRPHFTLNPTSCEILSTRATITGSGNDPFSSADDMAFKVSSPYQAASCASLKFRPTLHLAMPGATGRAGHPALRSKLTFPKRGRYANVGSATVILPGSEQIDNAHINNPCTRVQFAERKCPPSSVLGTAKAITPLLPKPLMGPVYFRSNGGERQLPDIVADLRGQFHIVLVGFVDTATPNTNPRLRTRFLTVPDAPVSHFELNLFGGKRGLLVNDTNLCARPRHATVLLTGQNGRPHDTAPLVRTSCAGGRKKHPGHPRH